MKESSESSESIGLLQWFHLKYPGVMIFHIPNERKCSIATGKRLKMEGVLKGIPDYMIPAWSLWIEMKTEKGRLSPAQKEMIIYLEGIGHTVIVGYGAKDASEKILEFTNKNY
jgi:hypothetical protein